MIPYNCGGCFNGFDWVEDASRTSRPTVSGRLTTDSLLFRVEGPNHSFPVVSGELQLWEN